MILKFFIQFRKKKKRRNIDNLPFRLRAPSIRLIQSLWMEEWNATFTIFFLSNLLVYSLCRHYPQVRDIVKYFVFWFSHISTLEQFNSHIYPPNRNLDIRRGFHVLGTDWVLMSLVLGLKFGPSRILVTFNRYYDFFRKSQNSYGFGGSSKRQCFGIWRYCVSRTVCT